MQHLNIDLDVDYHGNCQSFEAFEPALIYVGFQPFRLRIPSTLPISTCDPSQACNCYHFKQSLIFPPQIVLFQIFSVYQRKKSKKLRKVSCPFYHAVTFQGVLTLRLGTTEISSGIISLSVNSVEKKSQTWEYVFGYSSELPETPEESRIKTVNRINDHIKDKTVYTVKLNI